MPVEDANTSTPVIVQTANAVRDVKYCTKRRSTIKAQITNFHTFLDTMQEAPDYDHIQARMESLMKFFSEFLSIQIDLEVQQPDNEEHDVAREEIETNYHRGIARARGLLRKSAETIGIDTGSISGHSTLPPRSNHQNVYKKLPELNPPKFDGQLENWATFKARFSSMICKNEYLSKEDKLQYLQSSLTGRAAKAIESLEMSDSNYEDAWKLLIEKYDNTRRAILRHVNILMNLEPLKTENAEAIEELVDTIRQHLQSLKDLGQAEDQWECFITGLIIAKISNELSRQWELTLPDNKLPSYTTLIEFLAKRANCSDSRQTRPATAKGSSGSKGNSAGKKGNNHQAFNTDVKAPECPLCKEKHAIYQCSKFTEATIEARIKAAQQAQLCLNCLRGQHKTKTCKSKGRCRKCEKQHHTMLHLQTDEATASGSS